MIGIMSFTSYSEDHKASAILTCLGASDTEISVIYLNESLVVGLISVVFSLIVSYGLSFLVNLLINKLVGVGNMVSLPIQSFMGYPYLLPIISIFGSLLLCFFVTAIPIVFSKRIPIKEELQSLW